MSLLRLNAVRWSRTTCARWYSTQADAVDTAGAPSTSASAASPEPRQQESRRLLEILRPLPSFGVGTRVSKATWDDDCFWHVVDVSPIRRSFLADAPQERLEAKVYGIKYWQGKPEQTIKKLLEIRKKQWRRVEVDAQAQQADRIAGRLEGRWDWILKQGTPPASAEGSSEAAPAEAA